MLPIIITLTTNYSIKDTFYVTICFKHTNYHNQDYEVDFEVYDAIVLNRNFQALWLSG